MYKKGGSKIVFESPFCMLLNYFLNPKAVLGGSRLDYG